MKLNIFPFENEIIFNDSDINILEIHNKKMFANIVISLWNKVNGKESEEKIVLVDQDKIVNFEKDVMFIVDIFNVDLNQRKLLTNLYNKVNKDIIDNSDINQSILASIDNVKEQINEVISNYSLDFTFKNDISIQDYLKTYEIKFDDSFITTPLEKIMALIDITEMFELCKLLILCNIKNYFSDDELVEIYKYSKYKNVNILLIEQKESIQNLKYEKKLVIDDDFEDFII